MKPKRKVMADEEIDRAVVAQADDESAWEKPVKVRKATHAETKKESLLKDGRKSKQRV